MTENDLKAITIYRARSTELRRLASLMTSPEGCAELLTEAYKWERLADAVSKMEAPPKIEN